MPRYILVSKATRHEPAGATEVNPKTGKTIRGGEFAPKPSLTATQEKQVETALTSGQATLSRDGRKWVLNVKPTGNTRSKLVGTFPTLAAARQAILPALGVDGKETKLRAYSDVGEKIGGARKDIATVRQRFEEKPTNAGLEQLEKEDPAAASRACKKAVLWPIRSIDEMQADGVDPAFAYVVHSLHSLVAAKPIKDEPLFRQTYTAGVLALRAIVDNSNGSCAALSSQMKDWKEAVYSIKNRGSSIYRGGGQYEKEPDPTLHQVELALHAGSLGERFYNWISGRKRPVVGGQDIGFSWLCDDPSSRYSAAGKIERPLYKQTEPDPVDKRWTTVRKWLGVKEKAETLEARASGQTGEQAAAEALRERLREWDRTVPTKYERKGGKAISIRRPEDYLSKFGLRGVEFGNWMDDESSRLHVERCAEAFEDLADVLGIPAKKLSLNGRLALAFGARGQGARGKVVAVAHYEPHKVVINLTKEGGFGSLAHEWGHFLDHTIERIATSNANAMEFASEDYKPKDAVHQAVKGIMDIINKGTGEREYIPNPASVSDRASFGLFDYGWKGDKTSAKPFMDWFAANRPGNPVGKTQQIADYVAKKTGDNRPIKMATGTSEYRARMERAEEGKTAYWSQGKEMFARCFEAYLADKMTAKKRENNYLVGSWKLKDSPAIPYPVGEERKRLNAAFEKLFEAIKTTDMLSKSVWSDVRDEEAKLRHRHTIESEPHLPPHSQKEGEAGNPDEKADDRIEAFLKTVEDPRAVAYGRKLHLFVAGQCKMPDRPPADETELDMVENFIYDAHKRWAKDVLIKKSIVLYRRVEKSAGHAKAGGELGVNGEHYAGGQFLPSSIETRKGEFKRLKAKGGARKEEIEPYKWEIIPPGKRALMPLTQWGSGSIENPRGSGKLEPMARYDTPQLRTMLDKWNRGERVLDLSEHPDHAYEAHIARFVKESLPIPPKLVARAKKVAPGIDWDTYNARFTEKAVPTVKQSLIVPLAPDEAAIMKAVGNGVSQEPRDDHGRWTIAKILSIKDTREYEEGEDDKFHPIPNSGTLHNCDRCGKAHEVHAEVLLSNGNVMTVGTGCMKADNAEIAKRFTSLDSAAKTLAAQEARLAKHMADNERFRLAVEAAKEHPLPKVTVEERKPGLYIYHMGESMVMGKEPSPNKERLALLTQDWYESQAAATIAPHKRSYADSYKMQQDIDRTKKRIATLTSETVIMKAVGPFKYGSTQLNVDETGADIFRNWSHSLIDPKDLAADGLEKDIHITVKYGVLDANPINVAKALKPLSRIVAKLGPMAVFDTNPEFDVLYVSVISPDLVRANALVSRHVKCKLSDYGAYVPHMTVAYLKKGSAKKYLAAIPPDLGKLVFDSVVLSDTTGEHTNIHLEGSKGSTQLELAKAVRHIVLFKSITEEELSELRKKNAKTFLRTEDGRFATKPHAVVEVTGNELGHYLSTHDLQGKAYAWAKKNLKGLSVTNKLNGQVIEFNTEGINKSTRAHFIPKLLAIPALPKLMEEAKYRKTEADKLKRADIKAIHEYHVGLKIGNTLHSVWLVVRQTTGGHFEYDHLVFRLMKKAVGSDTGEHGTCALRESMKVGPNNPIIPDSRKKLILLYKAVKRDVSGEPRDADGKWTVAPSARAPKGVHDVALGDIRIDPRRFQFKAEGINPTTGVNDELKTVRKFDENLAGVVLVWMDPANHKTYIVNGHHRYDLAKRLKRRYLTVRYIQAANSDKAMITGALCNIAEGRGTVLDASKLLRTAKLTDKDLENAGVSLSGAIASQASGLANLCPKLWADVVAERMTPGRGAIIGHTFKSQAEQEALAGMLDRPEVKRKRLSDSAIMELAKFIQTSGKRSSTISTLFGEEHLERSLAIEKAQISAAVKAKLLADKRLFGFVSKQSRASVLERVGNKIEVERNREISEDAARIVEVYDKLSGMKGEISSALNAAARDLASGHSLNELTGKVYDTVRRAVGEVIGSRAAKPDTGSSKDPAGNSEPAWAEDNETGGLF